MLSRFFSELSLSESESPPSPAPPLCLELSGLTLLSALLYKMVSGSHFAAVEWYKPVKSG